MKTLTLEKLAGYLPYGLKIQSQFGFGDYDYKGIIVELTPLRIKMVDGNKWKPILHPLSDLTKEIEVNGERFVPIRRIIALGELLFKMSKEDGEMLSYFLRNWEDITKAPYWVIQKLFEWRFDIFNLIEDNLAIDINTLNP